MRVLVTGGAGFIGSFLVDRLLADGHSVIVLDRFSGEKMERCHKYWKGKRVKLVKMDISNFNIRISNLFKGIDWVFHLAGESSISESFLHPRQYHQANVDATVHLLEAGRKAGVKRFIFAASASCYGKAEINPTSETAPIQCLSPYALTKYLAEQYVLHWGRVYKLPVVSLRLFDVYGPRSEISGTWGIITWFMRQVTEGKTVTVRGDGSQKRDFVFVSDVVEAMIKAAKSQSAGEVFNLGTGHVIAINELVKLFRAKKTSIQKLGYEPKRLKADIRKIKNKLSWKPKVSILAGLELVKEEIKRAEYNEIEN